MKRELIECLCSEDEEEDLQREEEIYRIKGDN